MADQLFVLAVLGWVGMIVCVVGLCYVAAHANDDQEPEDTDPDMSAETPVPRGTLLDIQAGIDAATRELDEDLTVCRALWPDAPIWPDIYTPTGEDGTA